MECVYLFMDFRSIRSIVNEGYEINFIFLFRLYFSLAPRFRPSLNVKDVTRTINPIVVMMIIIRSEI